MQWLKDKIIKSPVLRPLDYKSGNEVILAIDTSMIAVGYILSQVGNDGKCYPSCFGSITLSDVEGHYYQVKLELFGLFRTLRAVCIFIFCLPNLTVEMDAKYVQGMINNPDQQPNATINRWITGILLFQFKLVHVAAEKHMGPDGLSHHPPSKLDPPEPEDDEDWLDKAYGFSIELLNTPPLPIQTYEYPAYGASSGIIHLSHTHTRIGSLLKSKSGCTNIFFSLCKMTTTSSQEKSPADPTIPQSDKAVAKDARILHIRQFLETTECPLDLSECDFQSFINTASHFFFLNSSLWHRQPNGCHQLVVPEPKHYGLIKEAHDDLGHKGVFSVCTRLLLHFWWPMLVDDVKWFIKTCHQCQIHQTRRLRIPPTVPVVGGLFRRVHIDTMLMPHTGGYRYIVQACCALTAYPEWHMLQSKSTSILASFIFEDLLC